MDNVCLYGAAGVLVVAAALVLVRTVIGPSVFDRAVGLDTLSAICLAAIAVDAAQHHDGEFLPILLLLALVGFTGSVCLARFGGGGEEISGEDGCGSGPGDLDALAGTLPEPLPESELEKRREEGL
ncbi:MAG TPA: monovalent cation/H+ antiporter complex subunit F [Actinospica sp.]|jgi:multicomponent Na+:H+ antiporter subunit F|nr:monovalent cation/H+ antiporter complex subunit F [Actinospica sp.]